MVLRTNDIPYKDNNFRCHFYLSYIPSSSFQKYNPEPFSQQYIQQLIQLNNNIFAIITQNMDMEVPEGTYTLKVANNGWGGTQEIEIVRGETTEIDLEELKGEGKKRGIVKFEINVIPF